MSNLNGDILNCILIFQKDHPNDTINGIQVRPLRHKFIVTAKVNGVLTKQEIPREVVKDRPALCVCVGEDCNEIGPIGNLCDSCEDTGNIFADEIQNVKDYIEVIQQSVQKPATIYYYYG